MFRNQIPWNVLHFLLLTQLFFGALKAVAKSSETTTMKSRNETTSTKSGNETGESDEIDERIVNGRPAKAGEAPYQISLGIDRRHKCGGSLVVSPRTGMQYVITAAHCVTDRTHFKQNRDPSEYYVRAGSIDVDKGMILQVYNIVVFPNWVGDIGQHDIALIFFRGEFPLGDDLFPIDLPEKSSQDQVAEVLVSGWGVKQEGSFDLPSDLQIVKVPVVSKMSCNRVYAKLYSQKNPITENVICAGYRKGGKDSCQGDSGGPAVALDKRGKFLVGLVSFGHGCARPGIPGIYTRISKYLGWINYVVKQQLEYPWETEQMEQSRSYFDYY